MTREVHDMTTNNRQRLRSSAMFGMTLFIFFFGLRSSDVAYAQTGRRSSENHPSTNRHDHNAKSRLPGYGEPNGIAIPNLTVTDQGGREVRLFTDLIKDRLVVLNFFYTTCEGTCPTSGHWLSQLHDKLGARLGKEVIILSVTIDPERDTPERLRKWGEFWKRRQGWTLLTSRGKDLRELMKKFEPYPAAGTHSATVFVGDGTRNPVNWVALDILEEGNLLLNYLRDKGLSTENKK